MRSINVTILILLLFCGQTLSQNTICYFTIGFQNQDAISSVVPLSNSTFLATALNDTLKQTIGGGGTFQQMLVYKLNNQCDTLWSKAFTPIGLGGISNLKKLSDNRFLVSGAKVNSALFPFSGFRRTSPFVMLFDSNAVPIANYTYSLIIGAVTRSLQLPNGDILISGTESPTTTSLDDRVFLALLDSSLNPKWYKQMLPQSLTYQSGIKELLVMNDGCGLLLFTESLSIPNAYRPRIVKFDLSTGDTIQSALFQPNGVANGFEFMSISLINNELIACGYFVNQIFTTYSNYQGVVVRLDPLLNEKNRQLLPGKTIYDLLVLENKKLAAFAYQEFGISFPNRLYVLDSNLSLIDSSFQLQPSNKAILPYSIISFQSGQWICAGAVATSATTFDQSDMYFSVVNHSYGAPYVHDYCGLNWPDSIRKKPTSAFTAVATADSVFFTNTSVSGLQCQPDLKSTEWFIDNYQLLSDDQDLRVPKAPTLDTLRVRLVVSNYFGCKDTLNAKVVNTTGQVLGTDALAV
jgi:hypothetical protein